INKTWRLLSAEPLQRTGIHAMSVQGYAQYLEMRLLRGSNQPGVSQRISGDTLAGAGQCLQGQTVTVLAALGDYQRLWIDGHTQAPHPSCHLFAMGGDSLLGLKLDRTLQNFAIIGNSAQGPAQCRCSQGMRRRQAQTQVDHTVFHLTWCHKSIFWS